MRRKEFLKILLPVLTIMMAVPAPIMAAETEADAAVEISKEIETAENVESGNTETSESVEGMDGSPAAGEDNEGGQGTDDAGEATDDAESGQDGQDESAQDDESIESSGSGGTDDTLENVENNCGNEDAAENDENSGGASGAEGGYESSVGKENSTQDDQEQKNEGSDIKSDVDAPEDSDTASEKESNDKAESDKKNQELIAAQHIVELPVIEKDFRFWTVTRKYAFAKETLEIKEESNDSSRSIGRLEKEGVCYILKEEENGWLYVESGRVRGFVRTEQIITEEEGQELLDKYQKEAAEKAKKENTRYSGIQDAAGMASELIPWQENEAFTYLRATAGQTVIQKKYAVCNTDKLNIREGQGTDNRIVGTLSHGELCFIIADEDQEWVYVESGDVRGFVKKEYISFDDKTEKEVKENGEENYALAEELVKPEENKACYYTLTSIKTGVPQGEIRQSLLEFASQFIGNPYVWGGTSLTNGADCSGFVRGVYEAYGYELPRTSNEQSQYGTKIAVEDAEPGDLIFYAENGVVNHVVIYAGDGKTIEAMNESAGITQGSVDYGSAVWATRVLEDSVYAYTDGDISEVNAEPEMYGEDLGEFNITYYCACELCCDVETGITATGTPVIEGRTIAVDPSVIPYGTQVIINGHVFTAEDCGGAIKGNRVDIYVNSHERALELGVDNAKVYLLK